MIEQTIMNACLLLLNVILVYWIGKLEIQIRWLESRIDLIEREVSDA